MILKIKQKMYKSQFKTILKSCFFSLDVIFYETMYVMDKGKDIKLKLSFRFDQTIIV